MVHVFTQWINSQFFVQVLGFSILTFYKLAQGNLKW